MLAVVGTSHHTAPIELRERVALGRGELPGALLRLRAAGDPASVAPRRRFLRLGLPVRLVAG